MFGRGSVQRIVDLKFPHVDTAYLLSAKFPLLDDIAWHMSVECNMCKKSRDGWLVAADAIVVAVMACTPAKVIDPEWG